MYVNHSQHIDKIVARRWGTQSDQCLEFGDMAVVLTSPEECDEVIKAVVAAKDAMLAARQPEPVIEGTVTGRPQDAPYAPVLNGAGRGTAG